MRVEKLEEDKWGIALHILSPAVAGVLLKRGSRAGETDR